MYVYGSNGCFVEIRDDDRVCTSRSLIKDKKTLLMSYRQIFHTDFYPV